jgi:putative acetyltransferase
MDIIVRSERPEDREAVRAVNLAAFETPAEADVVDAMRDAAGYLPELSLVAEVDGEVVGHALFCEVTAGDGADAVTGLSLGPIAVQPALQRQGIGTGLIQTGLDKARRLGYPFVVLIGHPEYYPRFGFVPARPYGLETIWPVRDEVFMILELSPGALEDCYGTIHYPEPFANM